MTVRVTDRDRGWKRLRKQSTKPATVALVGIQGDEARESHQGGDLSVAEVATFHELGLGVPERSFLRGWFDENEPKLRAQLTRALRAVVAGKYTQAQALELLAQKWVGDIQERIANRIPPPLAEITIARKGSDVPLIDTGQLRSAITYIIQHGTGVLR